MRNVWLIFKQDVSSLFKNAMSAIITIGLVVLPSMFAWYNILACWNVFENTGDLSIAVASTDVGYTSDLVPIEVNVGDMVVSELRGNDQINWVITNADDAIEGTKSGKYYAALVIPEDFSRQMLTFYEGDPQSAEIVYYVNEKKNAISPNITGTGADTVSYQVNAAFADTLSEVAAGLAKALAQQADDIDADGSITRLTGHMREISTRFDRAADVLVVYSGLAQDSKSLVESSAGLVESARVQAQGAVSGIEGEKQSIRELASKLNSSMDELSNSLDSNAAALADLEGKADELAANASTDVTAVAAELRNRAADFDNQANALSARLAELERLRDELQSGVGDEIDRIIDTGDGEVEITAEIQTVVSRTVVLDKSIAELSKAIDILQQASSGLTDAAAQLESGDADFGAKADALRQAVARAKTDVESVKADFETNLKPGIVKLRADLETLAADIESAAANLSSLGADLSGATGTVESALDGASLKVDDASAKLYAAAQDMRSLADSIDAALGSGDVETLRALLEGNVDDLAAAFSAPVHIEREALFPVQNFGSAMAPLYCALAIFIGALLIMVATKPEVSQRKRDELDDPKPRQLYLGRFGVVGLLSLMQTTLLALGNMLFIKVQVADPILYLVCFWVSGLVFAFIIYTLVVSFGNLGKAIAVLLLIVQVTGCGGSYPLSIMPDFVQAISPYVPATHVVNAMRAAMFGVYQNDFWISIGKLALFIVPFLLLGLLLRKPLERLMHTYVSKVEESKLM